MKYFKNTNLTLLLIDLYKFMYKNPGKEITGLNVKITGFNQNSEIAEDSSKKAVINRLLLKNNYQSIETVSNTFFPINLWNPNLGRDVFFSRYNKIVTKIRNCPKNRYGIYFKRMINFEEGVNQLDEIIKFYESGNHRRSAMQVSVWDPKRDLKNTRMRGFPCMQQIVFSTINHQLILFVFFASQFLFQRAYGNYLGLCNLGRFMSHELRLPLHEINCFIGAELLDVTKGNLREIINTLERT